MLEIPQTFTSRQSGKTSAFACGSCSAYLISPGNTLVFCFAVSPCSQWEVSLKPDEGNLLDVRLELSSFDALLYTLHCTCLLNPF